MAQLAIKDAAILLGFSPESQCVYSELVELGDYWDREHVWDTADGVRALGLQKLRGYLFDAAGQVLQEFETTFDLATWS